MAPGRRPFAQPVAKNAANHDQGEVKLSPKARVKCLQAAADSSGNRLERPTGQKSCHWRHVLSDTKGPLCGALFRSRTQGGPGIRVLSLRICLYPNRGETR